MLRQIDRKLARSASLQTKHAGFGRWRALSLVVVTAGCTLLGSCATPLPAPHAHDPIIWSAAIGRLDDEKDDSSCSATLVAADVIATAAHCLFNNDRQADVTSLTFHPNLGGAPLPPAQGTKLIALGKDTKSPTRGDNLDVSADWALIRITPPVTSVTPIPIGNFTIADIDDVLAKGGNLSQAGYGVYGLSLGQHLYQQGNCQRLSDDKMAASLRNYILLTTCRPIKGDSGGPLLLTKASGERYLIGVISEYRFTHETSARITVAAGALGFVHEIASNP